jgi:hypothetical protein
MGTPNVIPPQPAVAAVIQSADTTDPTSLVSTSKINPSDVPEFERDAASNLQLNEGHQAGEIAHVDPNNPNPNLSVDTPDRYTAAVQAHEVAHNIQHNAGDEAVQAQTDKATSQAAIDSVYGYGGTEGLQKHFDSGKTVADLNNEQQASIPQNYMKEFVKAEKAGDGKAMDKLNKAYEPAIRQLRNMANPSTTTIDTTPDAPGGAPAALLGLAKPVKGMASNSTKAVDLKASDVHNPPKKAVDKSKTAWYSSASALGKNAKQ